MPALLRKDIDVGLVIAGVSAVLLLAIAFVDMYIAPPDSFKKENIISIDEGLSLQQVSRILQRENIISSPKIFSRIVILMKGENNIQSGLYYFSEPQNAFVVAKRIIEGERGFTPIRVTIPEGFTREQIAKVVSEKLQNVDVNEFLALTEDREGYLFPDTYYFFPNVTTAQVLEALESNFQEKTKAFAEDISLSGKSLSDIITLASIVEEEASSTEDRRKIAGVLWKRIEIGMPLQVDVTFKYINGKNTYELTLEDLKNDSPYNTYVHLGLPPTPISNPGADSIQAVLSPAKTDYLYFLADAEGNVYYSETFDEHVAKKKVYLP